MAQDCHKCPRAVQSESSICSHDHGGRVLFSNLKPDESATWGSKVSNGRGCTIVRATPTTGLNHFLRVSVILLLTFDLSGADWSGFKFENMLMQLYVTPHRHRNLHIILLLLRNHHYVLIRHFSRLVAQRNKHNGLSFVFPFCLHCFTCKNALLKHMPNCHVWTYMLLWMLRQLQSMACVYHIDIHELF